MESWTLPVVAPRDHDRNSRFESLYRAHLLEVRAYVRTLVRAEDVDDVVSSTWLTAWTRLDDLPTDDVRAWLFVTAKNHARNSWRSGRRAQSLVDAIEQAHQTRPGGTQSSVDRSELEPLLIALSELSADDRELMVLSGWFEMTPAEIAQIVDKRAGTVRVRLHRVRERVRRRVAELAEGSGGVA